MTATIMTPDTTSRADHPTTRRGRHEQHITPVPFHRLVRVELRKTVDTRAGLWLLIIMSLIGAAAMGALMIWGSPQDQTFVSLLGISTLPLFIILPVLGVMAATAEWSQRTGLTTFTLEPRRGRVLTAKLLAAVLLGLIVVAATMAAAAALTLLWGVLGNDMVWNLAGISLVGVAAIMVLFVIQGSAMGFAFLNTPAAIIAAIVAPTIWTIMATSIPALIDVAPWTDFTAAVGPIVAGSPTGDDWAHLASTSGIWVLLPLSIGIYRVMRSEVK